MTSLQIIDSTLKFGLGAIVSASAILLLWCLPRWHVPPKQAEMGTLFPDSQKLSENSELVRNLVALWIAQNNVVWGRLTVIAALQTAVYAGWFSVFNRDCNWISLFVAIVGWALSWGVYALIDCDLKWKYELSEKLKAADPRLLPVGVMAIQGWKIMRGIVLGFYFSNVLLASVSAIYCIQMLSATR